MLLAEAMESKHLRVQVVYGVIICASLAAGIAFATMTH